MVEIKSVKVDNWGVFFLQKLQNFFNKTDYCDLTLQFKDNSQLKVHRLVLSACTDFFNVLETRYNVTDDVLIMPKDLQADVVVPIVNFMYTGTLEFEVNMYPRLLKTARDMNMTVLLKLLDAHKRTVGESLRQHQQSSAPVLLNKGASANQRVNTYSRSSPSQKTYTQSGRKTIMTSKNISPRGGATFSAAAKVKLEKSPIRAIASTSYIRKNLPEPVQLVARYANSPAVTSIKGPSRFECTDADGSTDAFESSFDNISYESKPLITSKEDHEISFDKIKRTPATKRAYSSSNTSGTSAPPEKKPNIEDVKEYTEAARLRKEIVAQEAEEDPSYFEDDFQNDDDDDDNDGDNTGSVVIKSEGGAQVNHEKILSEVVKKYPHLLKNNKNIKLKILQKGGQPTTVLAVAKDPSIIASSKQQSAAAKQARALTVQSKIASKPEVTASKASPQVSKTVATVAKPAAQPKKIDSRTMHALIAKGAENTTGPWLCLDCGRDGRPISIPSYKNFRRHLIHVHHQKIDPRLCEHCGHRSIKRNDLHYHILTKHDIQPPKDLHFPKCGLCTFVALDQSALKRHKEEDHQSEISQQTCIYCNKNFQKEIQLYAHMRSNHKERARAEGVMDFSDDDQYEDETDKYVPNHPDVSQTTNVAGTGLPDSKIKVLSNITLPSKAPFVIDSQTGNTVLISTTTQSVNLEPSSEAEGLSNVASGIATSLAVLDTNAHLEESVETYEDDLQAGYIEAAMADVHGEILKKDADGTEVVTKFVTEEGSELQLTDAQKARLLEQLQGQGDNLTDNVVMILDASFDHQHESQPATDANNESAEGMELGDDSKAENDSTEWDEAQQESVDDQLKNEESIGTEDEEMASAENTSIDDDSQSGLVAEQEVSNDTVGKDSDHTEKASNKLISALEGDWTEEDEEPADEPVTRKTRTDSKKSSIDATGKGNSKSNDFESSQELDKNDSASEDKIESDTDVRIEEADNDKHTVSTEVEDESKNGGSAAANDKKQLAQKNELKTLMRDWGDEDDEGF